MNFLIARALQLLQPNPVATGLAWAARAALIALCAFVALFYLRERANSLTVAATTEYLEVTLASGDEPLNIWELHGITLCLRKDAADAPAADRTCGNPEFYVAKSPEEASLRWPPGTRLIFRSGRPGHLEVLAASLGETGEAAASDGSTITPGTRLLVDWARIEQGGGLKLRGEPVIGERTELANSTHFLKTGTYRIYEKLPRHPSGVPVAQGEFVAGDQVSFVHRGTDPGPVNAYVLVTRGRFSGPRFDTVVTTPEGFTRLQVSRLGGDPQQIRATEGDRIRTHAFWAAAIALLGFLGASLGIANHLLPKPKNTGG